MKKLIVRVLDLIILLMQLVVVAIALYGLYFVFQIVKAVV